MDHLVSHNSLVLAQLGVKVGGVLEVPEAKRSSQQLKVAKWSSEILLVLIRNMAIVAVSFSSGTGVRVHLLAYLGIFTFSTPVQNHTQLLGGVFHLLHLPEVYPIRLAPLLTKLPRLILVCREEAQVRRVITASMPVLFAAPVASGATFVRRVNDILR